ncbi:hypothetical protein K461DRAFT_71221 [Myriangium duriaei CBS 260.36]|uniref:Uncharacterized protein n=1 Tax=Myriangium duriaei CBS 260.36 TaxID=1168546 RepID=A0A9P4ITY4_9PEZI|nr:hypothetical protein K461DRAFT_71221 [Myriangium duriaei CBS 260.36]
MPIMLINQPAWLNPAGGWRPNGRTGAIRVAVAVVACRKSASFCMPSSPNITHVSRSALLLQLLLSRGLTCRAFSLVLEADLPKLVDALHIRNSGATNTFTEGKAATIDRSTRASLSTPRFLGPGWAWPYEYIRDCTACCPHLPLIIPSP